MEKKIERRRYFIHPSSQLKFIVLSILPALVMSVFCTYFLVKSGELVLKAERDKIAVEISSFNYLIRNLEKKEYPKEVVKKIKQLKKELISLQKILKLTYFDTIKEWNKTKMLIFTTLFLVLILVGIVSLLYSHRMAGPLFRLGRCIDMLSEGKRIPSMKFRKHDEFKELGISLEKLRKILEEKGLLK